MKQQTPAIAQDQGFEQFRKPTRREVFLETMDWIMPALVPINDESKKGTVCRPVHYAESAAFEFDTAGAAVSLMLSGRPNCSLRMR